MIRFSQVNKPNSGHHNPSYQRHHLIPRQATSETELQSVFLVLKSDGFDLEDFEQNGILLPCCEKEALRTGRPLHRGSHPRYNEIVIERLFLILKMGDCFDELADRLNFIRFRLKSLQVGLNAGLAKGKFRKLYLSARDPLRSNARFDLMDSRIEQMYYAAKSIS